jgi:hypothetical protein
MTTMNSMNPLLYLLEKYPEKSWNWKHISENTTPDWNSGDCG